MSEQVMSGQIRTRSSQVILGHNSVSTVMSGQGMFRLDHVMSGQSPVRTCHVRSGKV